MLLSLGAASRIGLLMLKESVATQARPDLGTGEVRRARSRAWRQIRAGTGNSSRWRCGFQPPNRKPVYRICKQRCSFHTLTSSPSGDACPASRPPRQSLADSSLEEGIVILGSVTTPGLYAVGVQRLLDAHPGAFYLRTDQTCPSLRPASPEGNPIYAVFNLGGATEREVCSAVIAAGPNAYGKWMDTTTDPAFVIPC